MDAKDRPLIASGVVLGMGMGGFVDGILFHQVLQTHNMLSAIRPPTSVVDLEINMFWDGVFHVATWLMTAVGLAMLWRAVRLPAAHLSTRMLVGALLFGWGVFNAVEGVVDHYVLQLHHVVERAGLSGYDHAFVLSGVLMLALGAVLLQGTQVRLPMRPRLVSG